MENDMENEEKKQGKHIYAIRLSLTCHFFNLLFPPNPKNGQIQNWMIVRYKKKVDAVNRRVTKEVAFQNLANCKMQPCNFT